MFKRYSLENIENNSFADLQNRFLDRVVYTSTHRNEDVCPELFSDVEPI